MPVHDWTKPDAGLFHHFHQMWSMELCNALNEGVLPTGVFALIEHKVIGVEPDVMAVSWRRPAPDVPDGGVAVSDSPPRVSHVSTRTDAQSYAARANRIGVRTARGQLVAVVEIVSPGNKDRSHSIRALIDKTLAFLARGVHVLLVDLFPPTPRDPHGIHRAVWDDVREDTFIPPPERPLTLASYVGAPAYTAYVQSVGVGGELPEMPLFLDEHRYVPTPLEVSYARTWERAPTQFREMVLYPERFPADEAD